MTRHIGPTYYTDLFDPLYAGRRWIIAVDAASAAAAMAQRLLEVGAEAVMVIAGNLGTGALPGDDVEVFITATGGTTIMDGIRAFAAEVNSPSPELCAAVEAFDPRSAATVLTGYFIADSEVCGRPVHGGARPEWKALDDKISVDELWGRAGLERAPTAIVEATNDEGIEQAVRTLDGGEGVVLVADNSEGWHGGGEYARYVAPGADWSATLPFFVEHARRVRVMPFLRGVPCSIHGLVTTGAVLAFRPVEMLVYRRPGSDAFVYAGMSTVWDPLDAVRDQMRRAAGSVGALIRSEVGYRGAFGIDGVATSDGFRPTELNPRLTPGLGMQAESAGRYPIGDINRAVIAGHDADLRLEEFERGMIAGADENRAGRWSRPITHLAATETIDQPITYDGTTWKKTSANDATATMSLGPAPQGSLVRVRLTANHGVESGRSGAAMAAASFAISDEIWDTRIGDLVPGTAPPG